MVTNGTNGKIYNGTIGKTPNATLISKYALNNSECYKVPASNTDQHKNSYFVKTTSDWNFLLDTHIRAETVNSFKTAVHTYVTRQ